MKEMEDLAFGFELMTRPSDGYYQELPERLGDKISVSGTQTTVKIVYP